MKTAIYPGSFNPWHDGHDDVLYKALKVFDQVVIAVGQNPDKADQNFQMLGLRIAVLDAHPMLDPNRIIFKNFSGLLVDHISKLKEEGIRVDAVIRGLRNGQDFEMEKTQQYHNEDLGLVIPVYYVVSDRHLVHVSSSAIRMIKKLKGT